MPETLGNPFSTLPFTRHLNQFSTLPLIRHLFDALHRHELVYCLWKSNPNHVRRSFTGESDMDVLFDARQKEKVESVLQSLGFKKFDIVPERKCLDIEDFIKLDYETGKLIHLHTHYRLAMGPLFSKNYQLGLEDELLASRRFNNVYGVYEIPTAHQLLVLYCNEALGLRMRDVLLIYLYKRTNYGEKAMQEYSWLKARTSEGELQKLLFTVFRDPAYADQLMSKGFDKKQLLKLRALLQKEFGEKLVYSTIQTALTKWKKELIITMRKGLRRIKHPVLCRRMNPRGGVVIAVIGTNGSDKSTIITNICKTFEMKLDVLQIHFGRRDERIPIAGKLLRKVKSLWLPDKKREQKDTSKNPRAANAPYQYQEQKNRFTATVYKIIEALLVANEKRTNLNRMKTAKQKGILVVCDQFPQNQILGYDDGPMLQHLLQSRNPVFKWLAGLEARVYVQAATNPPNLIVKLIADSTIVKQRKLGETLPDKLEAKIDDVKHLKMQETGIMVIVDASRPLHDVVYDVREAIWERL